MSLDFNAEKVENDEICFDNANSATNNLNTRTLLNENEKESVKNFAKFRGSRDNPVLTGALFFVKFFFVYFKRQIRLRQLLYIVI